LIGLWVLPRTWALLKASVNVLLEGVPEGLDLDALRTELARVPGITELHDLHVWSVTTGEHNLTVHLVVPPPAAGVQDAVETIAERYGIEHVTLQLEEANRHGDHAAHLHP
jgi:cobalt-zinc-cadmium efflux system protein